MSEGLRVASTNGVTIALHDLGGAGPPLLACHATGFHGRVWAPVAAELGNVAHCWAPDLRGHGDSTIPPDEDLAWPAMVDDVLAVVDQIGQPPLRAIGHSMGGAVLLLTELARPGTFEALWLYEPIVFPRVEGDPSRSNAMADAARRRRPWFSDREAASANYGAKPPFDVLSPAALRAYVDHGFRDVAETGTVELKCPPEIEGRLFEGGLGHDAFEHLGDVRSEVTVAASGDSSPAAWVAGIVADGLPHGHLERHERLTHFGPLEDPGGVAAAIRSNLHLG